jgi:hypothetical protein
VTARVIRNEISAISENRLIWRRITSGLVNPPLPSNNTAPTARIAITTKVPSIKKSPTFPKDERRPFAEIGNTCGEAGCLALG